MNLLIYIIKTILISGLLFGYYGLFLRNRLFHRFNRVFLLSIPLISFLLPAFHFNLPEIWNHSGAGSPIGLLGVGRGTLEETVTIYASQKSGQWLSWRVFLISTTLLISLFMLIRFYRTIRFLHVLPKGKSYMELPEATLYFVTEKGTPFSFFKSIFWSPEMEINTMAGKQILRHEIYHVKNNHSLDIFILEIASVFLWFNPFIYFIHRELRAIHEYTADAYAAAETNTYEYASLLLFSSAGNQIPFTHPFFKNQIKRRIAMMMKSKKNKKGLLGRIMILPLIALLICLFSFKVEKHFSIKSSKPVRVVIDAGHSGSFEGAKLNGIEEKDLVLSIAKKIQTLSKEYNVEVVMTRESDADAAGTDLKSSLNYRTAMAEKSNSALFISIHANMKQENSDKKENAGFEIYVPKTDNKFHAASVKLASIITGYIKPDYTIAPELKQSESGVMVLDKSTVPAILIECGFIDNKDDMDFMLNEKNQEKIARDILEGIRKYSTDPTTYQNNQKKPMDTLSYAGLNNLDPNSIAELTIDKDNFRVYTTLRNGKKLVTVINPEVEREWNTQKDLQSAGSANSMKMDSSAPLKKVEVEAEYPGGQTAWYQFLAKNMRYPDEAVSNEVQGTVNIEFVVKTDGTITDIRVINGPKALQAESMRVLTASGKWKPAMNHGVRVDSYRIQPFNYKLEVK